MTDVDILDENKRMETVELVSETEVLLPGVTWDGRRISRVEHSLGASSTRTKAWYVG
jgi:hypothetical protein